jgi:plasmid stabilization system protein ParE
MVKISFRQKANEDLNSIWNYTYETWSENQADKYYATIKFDCLEIGKNPKLGKSYNGISRNLLGIKSGKHIIFYHSNTDSILDLGLSKYKHREKFRKFAETHGFKLTTHFLDISKETRLKRVLNRNNGKGETCEFEVTRENFDFMEGWFETPTVSEMENGILITE